MLIHHERLLKHPLIINLVLGNRKNMKTMKINPIVSTFFYCGILTLSMSITSPRLVFANYHQTKDTKQESIINLTLNDLKENNFLKISAANGFVGNIKLNGRNIKKIVANNTQIPLANILKKGKNILEIAGVYKSTGFPFQVELLGPNIQLSQSSGGSRNIKQILVIYVDENNIILDDENQ